MVANWKRLISGRDMQLAHGCSDLLALQKIEGFDYIFLIEATGAPSTAAQLRKPKERGSS